MKRILATAVASLGLMVSAPAVAQDNYLFGFSTGGGQLELTTTSGMVVINAVDSGWYHESGFHTASNNNYIVGTCTTCSLSGAYNDYFTFDLSGVTGTITGATLSAFNPDYVSGVLSTWSVWDVLTPTALLDVTRASGDAVGLSIFSDFETGVLFGSQSVTTVVDGTTVSVMLNNDAITALNAGIGGAFSIGGTLREGFVIPGVPNAVPEPSTWAFMLLGFGALGFAMRRARSVRVLPQAV